MRFIGGKSLVLPYLKELIDEKTKNKKIVGDPIYFFNNIDINKIEIKKSKCFIYNNYSSQGGRMYLQEENALKIDYIRITIEDWKKSYY